MSQRLNNAAMDLAVYQKRIDDLAAIVHSNVALHVNFAGFAINFNHHDVGSKREGEVLGFEE